MLFLTDFVKELFVSILDSILANYMHKGEKNTVNLVLYFFKHQSFILWQTMRLAKSEVPKPMHTWSTISADGVKRKKGLQIYKKGGMRPSKYHIISLSFLFPIRGL